MKAKTKKIFNWTARVVVALIFFQTLFFKFTGAPESIYIFQQVGMEPWGRYLSGFAELIAGILILIPSTIIYGTILALLVIIPAVLLHLTILGIQIQGDGGLLFGMALIVLILSAIILKINLPKRK